MRIEERTLILEIKSGKSFDLDFTAPEDSTVITVNSLKLELVSSQWTYFSPSAFNFRLKTKSRFKSAEDAKHTKAALQKWRSQQESAVNKIVTATGYKRELRFQLFDRSHVFHGVWVASYEFYKDDTRLKVDYCMDLAESR